MEARKLGTPADYQQNRTPPCLPTVLRVSSDCDITPQLITTHVIELYCLRSNIYTNMPLSTRFTSVTSPIPFSSNPLCCRSFVVFCRANSQWPKSVHWKFVCALTPALCTILRHLGEACHLSGKVRTDDNANEFGWMGGRVLTASLTP